MAFFESPPVKTQSSPPRGDGGGRNLTFRPPPSSETTGGEFFVPPRFPRGRGGTAKNRPPRMRGGNTIYGPADLGVWIGKNTQGKLVFGNRDTVFHLLYNVILNVFFNPENESAKVLKNLSDLAPGFAFASISLSTLLYTVS